MRERGAGVEQGVEEGLAAAGCGRIGAGRLGAWVSVEAAAALGGLQVSLNWFPVLLRTAVWF